LLTEDTLARANDHELAARLMAFADLASIMSQEARALAQEVARIGDGVRTNGSVNEDDQLDLGTSILRKKNKLGPKEKVKQFVGRGNHMHDFTNLTTNSSEPGPPAATQVPDNLIMLSLTRGPASIRQKRN
jgi:hypothetical protein